MKLKKINNLLKISLYSPFSVGELYSGNTKEEFKLKRKGS